MVGIYFYLNYHHSPKFGDGIDVIEISDNVSINTQEDPDFKPMAIYHPFKKKETFSRKKNNRKIHPVKHLPAEGVMEEKMELPVMVAHQSKKPTPRYRTYKTLYFKEINPPPPWA